MPWMGTVHCTLEFVALYSKGSIPRTRPSDLWDVESDRNCSEQKKKKGVQMFCSQLLSLKLLGFKKGDSKDESMMAKKEKKKKLAT